MYIHKNFVVNSKNKNSYFGLILKSYTTGLRILSKKNNFYKLLDYKK